eukprot:4018530-Pleurochrysis_carterae.AAC.2
MTYSTWFSELCHMACCCASSTGTRIMQPHYAKSLVLRAAVRCHREHDTCPLPTDEMEQVRAGMPAVGQVIELHDAMDLDWKVYHVCSVDACDPDKMHLFPLEGDDKPSSIKSMFCRSCWRLSDLNHAKWFQNTLLLTHVAYGTHAGIDGNLERLAQLVGAQNARRADVATVLLQKLISRHRILQEARNFAKVRGMRSRMRFLMLVFAELAVGYR